MGQMISKPDANPIVLAVCNWFIPGLGYYLMGQKKKFMITLGVMVGIFILAFCTLGLGGILFLANFVFVYDAYLLGQKLQAGQSIGENENGLDFLNAIFKD